MIKLEYNFVTMIIRNLLNMYHYILLRYNIIVSAMDRNVEIETAKRDVHYIIIIYMVVRLSTYIIMLLNMSVVGRCGLGPPPCYSHKPCPLRFYTHGLRIKMFCNRFIYDVYIHSPSIRSTVIDGF